MVLTGARLDGAECHYLGLATHYIPQASLEELVDRITKMPDRLGGVLGAASASAPDAKISANMGAITRNFASDELEEVVAALEADGGEWATAELATIRTKSPLSCKVSLRLLEEGAARRSFAEEMAAEYALAGRVVRTHDFLEGVRALLIDKDNQPKWDPPSPEGVSDEMLDALFDPLPESERWTPFPGTGEAT
jgi:enoyl-CoA hydratase